MNAHQVVIADSTTVCRRRVLAATCGVLVALALPGCLWRRYGDMAATHGQLLVQFASDAADLAEAHFEVSARYLQAMEYPLVRAKNFSRRAAGLPGQRPSLTDLDATIGAYEGLFELMKNLRARKATIDESRAIRSAASAVKEAAAKLEQSLKRG